ncbi:CaiB/BaiF CoA transferase family protein [Aromatoleum petrolei]|uniref:CoA transferase n=1 Tax=Aromatoleum petrolei TaxID=76116 RepID=A0ABX1MU12_9RHOO|nr:CaiB/BaiF CoA-transferase family protein [Aromatoleum petrolei]NMF88602.1 hypothetical protein [Aromatoleum petrolei]
MDIGFLIPSALTSLKLATLGADVVKVERPGGGDRIRHIPPFAPDGESPQHQPQNRGKRSIALDLGTTEGRELFLRLARKADVIIENQLPGTWLKHGIDFAALRQERPSLIVCSVTGFGQTGPLSQLPSHGLNMDALADCMPLEWQDGQPRVGTPFTSWGNEMGSTYAAMAICAAIANVRKGGEGAWVDLSCWDAMVEAHRTEIAMSTRTGERFNSHDHKMGPIYNTYLSRDGKPVLLGALEPKFWAAFCRGIGREDMLHYHTGEEIEFGADDETLGRELAAIFVKEDAATWEKRFIDWDVVGCVVLQIDEVMKHPHFAARGIVEGEVGQWPNITSAIRWHHTGERAGSGMKAPPAVDADRDSVITEWLSA